MSTITYDERGLCTRCGSTGYYLSSYISDSSFADERSCVVPCPCHGWRPIECAPEYVQVLVGARYAGGGPQWQSAKAWLEGERSRWMLADREPAAVRVRFRPTHWQPLPKPPEGL